MYILPVRTRRWTRAEYDRLIALGILGEDEPIELIDGRLVIREPPRVAMPGLRGERATYERYVKRGSTWRRPPRRVRARHRLCGLRSDRIRQIEVKALRKLRPPPRGRHLSAFLER